MSGDLISFQVRIAVLEAELAGTRKELEESRKASLFLLGLRADAAAATAELPGTDNRVVDGLQSQIKVLQLENASLKDQIRNYGLCKPNKARVDCDDLLIDLDDSCTSSNLTDNEQEARETLLTASARPMSIRNRAMLNGTAEWESEAEETTPVLNTTSSNADAENLISIQSTCCNSPKSKPETPNLHLNSGLGPSIHSSHTPVTLNAAQARRACRLGYSGFNSSDNGYGFAIFDPTTPDSLPSYAVLVTGLALDTTLDRLLPRIRGGQLFLIRLLDTRHLNGGMTAFVRFLESADARAFVRHHETMPLVVPGRHGAFAMHDVANVSLIPTSSWRMPPGLISRVRIMRVTRCFSIMAPEFVAVNSEETLVKMVERFVGQHVLVCVRAHDSDSKPDDETGKNTCLDQNLSLRSPGVIYVECSSVEAADSGRNALLGGPFRGCESHFEDDPCDAPYHEHWFDRIGHDGTKKQSPSNTRSDEAALDDDKDIGIGNGCHKLNMTEDHDERPGCINPDAIDVDEMLNDSETGSGESEHSPVKTPDTSVVGEDDEDLLL